MTDVEKAEKIVADLEAKRAASIARGTALADERANTAFGAHTGDGKAAKRLEEIHIAIATHASELASLDAALRTATDKVDTARHAAAQAEDQNQARELRVVLKEFVGNSAVHHSNLVGHGSALRDRVLGEPNEFVFKLREPS